MGWSKLVDMELDDDEKLDNALPSAKASKPDYPWGLQISFTGAELKKLGLEAPDLGDLIDMRCFAVVTSVSSSQTDDGDCCRVEMQIQKISVENEMTESDDDD